MKFRSAASLLFALCLCAQDKDRIVVTIERQSRAEWTTLDPKTVLDSGDRVRFRLRSSSPGWLYAYYTDSTGKSDWLAQNGQLIVKDQQYTLPPDSTYTVSGAPGFDVVYWILSPKPIPPEALIPSSAKKNVPNTMRPRCKDLPAGTTQTACLDDRAGPASLRSRELKLEKPADGAAKTEPQSRNVGVLVYEFRIAHR